MGGVTTKPTATEHMYSCGSYRVVLVAQVLSQALTAPPAMRECSAPSAKANKGEKPILGSSHGSARSLSFAYMSLISVLAYELIYVSRISL